MTPLRALALHPGRTVDELACLLGARAAVVGHALRLAEQRGDVEVRFYGDHLDAETREQLRRRLGGAPPRRCVRRWFLTRPGVAAVVWARLVAQRRAA